VLDTKPSPLKDKIITMASLKDIDETQLTIHRNLLD